VLLACVRDRAERDAELINDSLEGIGTDDDVLRWIVTSRSNRQLLEIADAYERMFKKSLMQAIAGDTSLSYRWVLLLVRHDADLVTL